MAYAPAPTLVSEHGLSKKTPLPKKTPAKTPPPKKTPPAKTVVPKAAAPQTDVQQAAALATAQLAPQKADIARQQADAETQRQNSLITTQKLQEAMAHLTEGDPAAAQAAFQQAADSIAGYAKGLTGSLGSLEQQQAAQQSGQVAAIGAPGGPVVDHGDANANVDNLVGGVIPASTLASAGAGAYTAAQDHARAAGIRILDQGSANDYQSQKVINDFRQKILDLDSQYPGLVATALQQIKQQANAKRATDTQIGYLQLQQAKTAQDKAVAMTNLTGTLWVVKGVGKNAVAVDTHQPAGGSAAARAQAQVAATNAATAQRAAAATKSAAAKVKAAQIAAAGKKAAAEIAHQKAAGKPPTVQQKSAVIKAANQSGTSVLMSRIQQYYANNVPPQGKKESADDYKKHHAADLARFEHVKTYNWYNLYAVVFANIAPQLRLLGWTPAQMRAATRNILASQIHPPKGQ